MRIDRYIIVLMILAGCKATTVTQQPGSYYEDLSVHRLDLSENVNMEIDTTDSQEELGLVIQTGHIKTELDSINRIIIEQNRSKYWDGFEIQVYNGNSRQLARETLARLKDLYPELDPYMSYYQPNYRVKAGKFFDRLKATRNYEQVKISFPRALLIPGKLQLDYE